VCVCTSKGYTSLQTIMSDKTYHVEVTNVCDLTPKVFYFELKHQVLYSGYLNSLPRGQVSGALAKELASYLIEIVWISAGFSTVYTALLCKFIRSGSFADKNISEHSFSKNGGHMVLKST
jgi:hypothetical protein